jgi:NAD(P)-dependent dehydrogenase (short-subunit alcohol dehydrogenase family)
MRLADRFVIVTGGGRGLGRAYARAFAGEGATVAIADIDAEASAETAAGIETAGGRVIVVPTDVTDAASVDAMVERVTAACGRIDVLVNNAGLYDGLRCAPVEALTTEEWDAVYAVNVRGTFHGIRAVVPGMKARGSGKIVNVASETAIAGTPYMAHYVATKGAIVALGRALARELGPFGITVNTLVPGLTDSGATKRWDVPPDAPRSVPSAALARPLTPDDLVGAAVFLASADSDMMTGQLLVVNGGSSFG